MAVEGMREGSEFPGAHVAGEKQDTFPAALSAFEILGAVDSHDLRNIRGSVFWELRELARHPADLADHSANDSFAFRLAHIGKCELKIEHRCAPEGRAHLICERGKRGAHLTGCAAWKQAKRFESRPCSCVFEPLSHRASLCKRLESRCQRCVMKECLPGC